MVLVNVLVIPSLRFSDFDYLHQLDAADTPGLTVIFSEAGRP